MKPLGFLKFRFGSRAGLHQFDLAAIEPPVKLAFHRGHFPSDDAASKLIWLALRNITADCSRAAKEWKLAMNQFAILYEERFTQLAHSAGR